MMKLTDLFKCDDSHNKLFSSVVNLVTRPGLNNLNVFVPLF